MNRCLQLMWIGVAAISTVQVQAADVFWMSGTGNLTDSNYSDGVSTNLAPQEADVLFLGNSGVVSHSVGGFTLYQKLRVGHDLATPGGVGPATLTVNNGAQLNLTSAGGGANASLIIGGGTNTAGSGVDGTLNIDGAGSSVTSAQLVQIGFGGNANANATVNITDGGSLTATSGNINLGERAGNATSGLPGHLNISGASSTLTISVASADLNVGVRAASSYVQTGGTATIGDAIVVGNNEAHGSSFSVSGGDVTSKSVTIGQSANNATGSITGDAIINVTTNNFNVGLNSAQGASLLVADNAAINVLATTTDPAGNGNVFIGRGTSSNTTFTMTGGTIDTGRNFLLGNGSGVIGVVGNQSGGTITTTLNFVVNDSDGDTTYNLSGNGAIVVNGLMNVGRRVATGVMNQTGGSVTSALGIAVGNAESTDTALWGTGIYNVSGGTITANQTTGPALRIAPQGTGTFRVIGDDATINVNGDALINANGDAQGTLAYQLEAGDLLSMINVTGTATFNAGAILNFDTSLASPTQTSYDLLTAAVIDDLGIAFSGPAGWGYQIVDGLNGKILRAVQGIAPVLLGDFNNDGKVDAGDYVTWRKNDGPNASLPNDDGATDQAARFTLWRANFGNPPGAGASLEGAQVPEPASLALVLIGVAALASSSRRRSRVHHL